MQSQWQINIEVLEQYVRRTVLPKFFLWQCCITKFIAIIAVSTCCNKTLAVGAYHSADLNLNNTIEDPEMSNYADGWRAGNEWPEPPNPISIDYVTRAAVIWKLGGEYYDDGQLKPLGWVPDAIRPNIELFCRDGSLMTNSNDTPSLLNGSDFGSAKLGEIRTSTFQLINTGGAPLMVTSVKFQNSSTTNFVVMDYPARVDPNQMADMTLAYSPKLVGIHSNRVIIQSNDSEDGRFEFAIRGEATSEQIGSFVIKGENGEVITPGAVSTSRETGTDLGLAMVSNLYSYSKFTVTNVSTNVLVLSAMVNSTCTNDFGVFIETNILPGTEGDLYVFFFPEFSGGCQATVTVSSAMLDEHYRFIVKGEAIDGLPPDMLILGTNGQPITSSENPVISKGTDWGIVELGQTLPERTFWITNAGPGVLILDDLKLALGDSGFTLSSEVPDVLPAGSSIPISFTFTALSPGFSVDILYFRHNANTEDTFYLTLIANVQAPAEPTLQLLGSMNGQKPVIQNDSFSSTNNGTTFPRALVGGGTTTNVFSIRNVGEAVLTLGAITVISTNQDARSSFYIIEPEITELPVGSSTTFRVAYKPVSGGSHSAHVALVSNDPDTPEFRFEVSSSAVTDMMFLYSVNPEDDQILRIVDTNNTVISVTADRDEFGNIERLKSMEFVTDGDRIVFEYDTNGLPDNIYFTNDLHVSYRWSQSGADVIMEQQFYIQGNLETNLATVISNQTLSAFSINSENTMIAKKGLRNIPTKDSAGIQLSAKKYIVWPKLYNACGKDTYGPREVTITEGNGFKSTRMVAGNVPITLTVGPSPVIQTVQEAVETTAEFLGSAIRVARPFADATEISCASIPPNSPFFVAVKAACIGTAKALKAINEVGKYFPSGTRPEQISNFINVRLEPLNDYYITPLRLNMREVFATNTSCEVYISGKDPDSTQYDIKLTLPRVEASCFYGAWSVSHNDASLQRIDYGRGIAADGGRFHVWSAQNGCGGSKWIRNSQSTFDVNQRKVTIRFGNMNMPSPCSACPTYSTESAVIELNLVWRPYHPFNFNDEIANANKYCSIIENGWDIEATISSVKQGYSTSGPGCQVQKVSLYENGKYLWHCGGEEFGVDGLDCVPGAEEP